MDKDIYRIRDSMLHVMDATQPSNIKILSRPQHLFIFLNNQMQSDPEMLIVNHKIWSGQIICYLTRTNLAKSKVYLTRNRPTIMPFNVTVLI